MRTTRRQRARERSAAVAVALFFLMCVQASVSAGEDLDLPSAQGLSRLEKERFLATAEVVSEKVLQVGVTGSRRATLTNGSVFHDAHVQSVNVHETAFTGAGAHYLDFRDNYKYNIAAYRVSVLVGYDRVPVSVERRLGSEWTALTWWVDDVAMMETQRLESEISPPDVADFYHQMRQARVFAQLIHNFDLNPGNLLITDSWDVWSVDFTRSFRRNKRLLDVGELGGRLDRRFLEGMRSLTFEQLVERVYPYLSKPEIRSLLHRRDRIVEFYDRRIDEVGEAIVVCGEVH